MLIYNKINIETIHHQTITALVNMKPYTQYTAEELAVENLFIRWVKYPDDTSVSAYWEGWVKKFPEKVKTVDMARQLVLQASETPAESLTTDEVKGLWGRIRNSVEILPEIKPLDLELKIVALDWYFYRWLVAAVVVVLMTAFYLIIGTFFVSSTTNLHLPAYLENPYSITP